MTNGQPRVPRPSAIRRRPQPAQSVDDFIHGGIGVDTPPLENMPAAATSVTPPPIVEAPPRRAVRGGGERKAYFALFLGVCALGVSLFDAYRLLLAPPAQTMPQDALPSTQVAAARPPSEVVAPTPAPVPPAPLPSIAATPLTSMSNVQGMQWLALTDLQFARHDLLLGLNSSAMAELVLAKIHLNYLGKQFAPEAIELDRIISALQHEPVLSLGQMDHDIEALKEAWVRVTFGPPPANEGGLLGWLTPWHHATPSEGRTELETTDAGRYLVARLDRLKWLALWGDEAGLRKASATLDDLLGPQFLKSPEAKPWLFWIRGLQRTPLRHDVTELNTLIVRLSRLELPP